MFQILIMTMHHEAHEQMKVPCALYAYIQETQPNSFIPYSHLQLSYYALYMYPMQK